MIKEKKENSIFSIHNSVGVKLVTSFRLKLSHLSKHKQYGHSAWKTWKYLELILNLEKHQENSIFDEIHLGIPGKIFSCCKKNLTANHKIDFCRQCTY